MPPPQRPGPTRAKLLLSIVAALALGYYAGERLRPPPEPPEAPGEKLADTATVLVAVRGLSRLETVEFHMERVIDLKHRQARMFGLLQGDDEILLVAAGDVIAGIDLSKMQEGDIAVDPTRRAAKLRLPAAEILSARLDNERTYVHSRKTDLFAKRIEEIETRARQHAESSVRHAALDAGILTTAETNARQTLSTLVRSLGFELVEVTFGER